MFQKLYLRTSTPIRLKFHTNILNTTMYVRRDGFKRLVLKNK